MVFQQFQEMFVCVCVCARACVREILVLNFNSQENSVSYFDITKKWCG